MPRHRACRRLECARTVPSSCATGASRLRHVFVSSAHRARGLGVRRQVCLVCDGRDGHAVQGERESSDTVAVQSNDSHCFGPCDGIVWQAGRSCSRKQCAVMVRGWLGSINDDPLIELQARISQSRPRVSHFTQRSIKGVMGYEEQSKLNEERRGILVDEQSRGGGADQHCAVRREGWREPAIARSLSRDGSQWIRAHILISTAARNHVGLEAEPDARSHASDFRRLGPPGP